MEIFVDGGLFELIIAMALGYTINYIFLRKYLLIAFSVISIISPIALLFIRTGELYSWLAAICILNSGLLIILLWRHRLKFPNHPLFNVDKLRRKVSFKRSAYNEKEAVH